MKIIIFEFFVLIKYFLFIISILGILVLAHQKNLVQANVHVCNVNHLSFSCQHYITQGWIQGGGGIPNLQFFLSLFGIRYLGPLQKCLFFIYSIFFLDIGDIGGQSWKL